MLIDSMKSEELSSLGNSLCSLATGTYMDEPFQLPTFPSYSAVSEWQYDSAVGGKINLFQFLFLEYTYFFPQVKRMLSLERPSYGQIMALYGPYSDLDKNMLRGYVIWQIPSFPLMKQPHKCITKLAIGLKYSLLILLELFSGLRHKTLLCLC